MSISSFRRNLIEQLIAENGSASCHYCNIECRIGSNNHHPNCATIDHKIPRSKGGTNARENLLLSCNQCNNLKGDRSYEEFIYSRRHPWIRPRRSRKIKVNIGDGTLADAIRRGEVEPHGVYKRHPVDMGEPRNRIMPSSTYYETMRFLASCRRAPKKSDLLDKR